MKNSLFIFLVLWYSFSANTTFAFDRQDNLRGGNGRGRYWWDVQHYSLVVSLDTVKKAVDGFSVITMKVTAAPADSLQLDLQDAMILDSVIMNDRRLSVSREGNVWWVKYPFNRFPAGASLELTAYFHGRPRVAKHAPWDGGFIWTRDSTGKPWVAVACQGLGASSWWPCKDYQADEPDRGMDIDLSYPAETGIVLNGRSGPDDCDWDPATRQYGCAATVSQPINTYNATFYIGDYVSWTDTLQGEKGRLDLSFHALRYNDEKARTHFAVTKQMLHCFEYWMGPYPFYEDGYKLVEAPYLGMEHQSAVAYGNKYLMGYQGSDRSGTGIGLLFDFIIVHESGHEWFGNSITAADVADNWLHEGFTTYTEALFLECAYGRDSAFQYTTGQWKNIDNDKPVIGTYGVHNDGSGDKYDKGSAVVHMIRMIMNNDTRFRQLLRALNKDFYHKTVTSAEVEAYISKFAGYNFAPLFDQYLRTAQIPKLEWYVKKKQLYYRFTDVVPGFTLPIELTHKKDSEMIHPTAEWQSIKWKHGFEADFGKNFLIKR